MTKCPEYALDYCKNLINSSHIHNLIMPKFHENPAVMFWVILPINRQTDKQTHGNITVPLPNNFTNNNNSEQINNTDVESKLFLRGQLVFDLTQFLHQVITLSVELFTLATSFTQLRLQRQLNIQPAITVHMQVNMHQPITVHIQVNIQPAITVYI